jgi:O-antigen ligase
MIKWSFFKLEYLVLILLLILIRFPVAIGFRQNPTVRFIFIIPLLIATSYRLFVTLAQGKLHLNKEIFSLFGLYCCFLSFAYLRTAISGVMPVSTVLGNWLIWITIALFSLTLFGRITDEKTVYRYRRGIFIAFGIYVLLNVGLHFSGFRSPEILYTRPFGAALLTNFGIATSRVIFPTASGINSFGTMMGALLVASLATVKIKATPRFDKLIALFGGSSSLIIMLLTDSRGALAFSAVTIFLIIFLPKKMFPTLKWIPFLTPLIPIGLYIFLNLLPVSITSYLSRSQNDISNMSNRITIWQTITSDLATLKPEHLWGYGYRGQVVSEVSRQYASLFSAYLSDEVASAHNFLLQSILEVGYIGTIIFLILLSLLIKRLSILAYQSKFDHTPMFMLFILIYYILMGTTEAIFSTDFQEAFTIFLLILFGTGATTRPYENQSPDYSIVTYIPAVPLAKQ